MPTKQGDLALLDDPVAQDLLRSGQPARLAYVWPDGSPRVVPIGFHWNGRQIVLGTGLDTPKLKALRQNPKVALTIDTATFPFRVLLIRGTASIEQCDHIPEEYVQMSHRLLGEAGSAAWLGQLKALNVTAMARVTITPEWAGILDFETRFPHTIERAIEAAQGVAAAPATA